MRDRVRQLVLFTFWFIDRLAHDLILRALIISTHTMVILHIYVANAADLVMGSVSWRSIRLAISTSMLLQFSALVAALCLALKIALWNGGIPYQWVDVVCCADWE